MYARTYGLTAVALACGVALTFTTLTHGADSPVNAAATRPAGEPGVGQDRFDTDDKAAPALVAAVKARDPPALDKIFGPSIKDFVTGDKVEDEKAFDHFVQD